MQLLNEKMSLAIDSLLKNYTDKFGLITNADKDSGDALQRNSTYLILLKLMESDIHGLSAQEYVNKLSKFEVKSGTYVRNPDPDKWYSNPNNCSRDQISLAAYAMCLYKDKHRMNRLLCAMAKRGFLFQNYHMGTDVPTLEQVDKTVSKLWPSFLRKPILNIKHNISPYRIPDIMTPSFVSTIIRTYKCYPLYPLLLLLDIFPLLDVLHFRKGNLWDSDNMLASQILTFDEVMTTPWIKLAKKLYKKTDYKQRILNYYFKDNQLDLCKPLGELYVEILKIRIG